MLCTRTLYHALALAALAGTCGWTGTAAAAELAFSCQGTTITLSCQEGPDTGNCVTQSASDPGWNVTCRGFDEGDGRFKMQCSNATAIGGTPVEIKFSSNQFSRELAQAVGDTTGTSCTPAQ